MRIPTLLGLSVLSIILTLGVAAQVFYQRGLEQKRLRNQPRNILLANLQPTSASLAWQTDGPDRVEVVVDKDPSPKGDPAISVSPASPQTPPVSYYYNLAGLEPDTVYYYKIKVGQNLYPDQPLSFKTPPAGEANSPNFAPVVGTVLDADLQPVKGILVLLEVSRSLPLSALTNSNGNFVIPVVQFYRQDNLQPLATENQEATLVVEGESLKSTALIRLEKQTRVLPPIVLGQDIDLREYRASDSAEEASPSAQSSQF